MPREPLDAATRRLTDSTSSLLHVALHHPLSLVGGWRDRRLLDGVRRFCFFVGYPHSGHSLVGALLDAHPSMAVAHELGVLKHLTAHYRRRQLFHMLLRNATAFAAAGREWNGYSYAVPGQWQGRWRELIVIGDKHGDGAALRLAVRPHLLARLRHTVRCPLRVIHVTRNPFDSISTLARRTDRDLAATIGPWFARCETVSWVQAQLEDDERIDVRHEGLVRDAPAELRRLCAFLGVPAPDDYVTACAEAVRSRPRRARDDAPWTPELVVRVEAEIERFAFLDGYGFDT